MSVAKAHPPMGGTPASGERYAYLVGRLRNRQITMEEATELFGIMDATIRSISAAAVAASAPRTPTAPKRTEKPAAPPLLASDDLLPFGILLVGAASGISAAVRERSRSGPRKSPPEPVR
ncbi:MAG: hypothetical protein ABSA15_03465 [Thermoplasmata archaeon]|jgi:hypothetical protein